MWINKWLKSWFVKSETKYDLFLPKERNIYHYMTGGNKDTKIVVDIDPMILEKRLANVRNDLLADIKVARSPVSPKDWVDKRYEAALEKIRAVFDVKPYAEGGLLEEELFALLDHFVEFTDTIKKNSRISQTSVEEISPVTKPLLEPPCPTTSSSDSGSTEKEPSTDKQEQLPTEQESPSDCTPLEENTTKPLPTESPKPT